MLWVGERVVTQLAQPEQIYKGGSPAPPWPKPRTKSGRGGAPAPAVPAGAVRQRGHRCTVPDGAAGRRSGLPTLHRRRQRRQQAGREAGAPVSPHSTLRRRRQRRQQGQKRHQILQVRPPSAVHLQGLQQDVQRQDGDPPALQAHRGRGLDAGGLDVPGRAPQRHIHTVHIRGGGPRLQARVLYDARRHGAARQPSGEGPVGDLRDRRAVHQGELQGGTAGDQRGGPHRPQPPRPAQGPGTRNHSRTPR